MPTPKRRPKFRPKLRSRRRPAPASKKTLAIAAHVGGRIRIWRQARHLTLAELAEEAQVERAQLSKLERGLAGVQGPGIGTLARVAAALDRSVYDLFAA